MDTDDLDRLIAYRTCVIVRRLRYFAFTKQVLRSSHHVFNIKLTAPVCVRYHRFIII